MKDGKHDGEKRQQSSTSSSSSLLWSSSQLMWMEGKCLIELAIPTTVIQLSFTVPSFLTASYIGRQFGSVYLDGYTLAMLTGNLLTLALLQGLFIACDTLSPQAFGAGNYREVGLLAIRGFVSTLLLIIPINAVLFLYMEKLLEFCGQDSEAAEHAWHFYLVYAPSFPFNSLFCILWKFLSSQSILTPLVVCSLVSMLVVLPICLEIFLPMFGFLGSAAALTCGLAFQALSLLAWVRFFQPHHPDSWPGISAWREALAWQPMRNFWILSFGGMLACLEWMFWEALALVVGSLGVLPLSAHTVPTQVMFVTFMFSLGAGTALAIRLGHTLASPNLKHNVERAQFLAAGTTAFCCLVFGLGSVAMYVFKEAIFGIFTKEEPVLELLRDIWLNVCWYFFVLSAYGLILGISLGLGIQWTLGIVTVISLWLVGMPATYYLAVVRGGGLRAVWICIWPPYLMINAYMVVDFFRRDWHEIARAIQIREGVLEQGNGGGGELESLILLESAVIESIDSVTKYGSSDTNNGSS